MLLILIIYMEGLNFVGAGLIVISRVLVELVVQQWTIARQPSFRKNSNSYAYRSCIN
jgi:hypothetical protein